MQQKDWCAYSKVEYLKKHLIAARGHRCEQCKNTEWMQYPIPLEVHHKDGDRTNNSPENLSLLCPNCHSLTDNYRGRKSAQVKVCGGGASGE